MGMAENERNTKSQSFLMFNPRMTTTGDTYYPQTLDDVEPSLMRDPSPDRRIYELVQ